MSSTVPGTQKMFNLCELPFSLAGWPLIPKTEAKGQESSSWASYPMNFFLTGFSSRRGLSFQA